VLESLWQNHPFIDGNKRTAITTAAAFLRVNGYRLDFDDLQAYGFLMRLGEAGQFRFARLDAWLREHARPTESP
jgi:death-on-curing protein